jgi:hypothetical protein
MKRARRQNQIIKGGIATALLLCSCYGAFRYAHAAIAHAPLTVIHDPLISDQYQIQLASELTNEIHAKGPAHVVKQPSLYSPLLASLKIHYTFPYHGILNYSVTEPSAQLNQSVVALKTGDLVPQDLFSAEKVETLPVIHVPTQLLNESQAPEMLKLFLNDISSAIIERFSCEWHDADSCCYRDRQHAQYTLVADGRAPINDDDIKLYEAVLQQLKPERMNRKWTVDIRFKGQVVITPDGGV